jgi:hypothetical protein
MVFVCVDEQGKPVRHTLGLAKEAE